MVHLIAEIKYAFKKSTFGGNLERICIFADRSEESAGWGGWGSTGKEIAAAYLFRYLLPAAPAVKLGFPI
jgi:hypothetical protein